MFRGRGRGRGPAGPKAVARDDDGNAVQVAEGPPPLYPEKELPALPSETVLKEAEGLVKSLSAINSGFQNSPFNLGALGDKKSKASMQDALASVVTLDPNYFPKELYSEEQRSRGGSKEAQAAYWATHTHQRQRTEAFDFDLSRLEELARQESQRTAAADAAGRGPRAGGHGLTGDDIEGGEEADNDADGGIEDDDAFAPEDDPYEQYDDDEGYEDPDDDGGGEGGADAFF